MGHGCHRRRASRSIKHDDITTADVVFKTDSFSQRQRWLPGVGLAPNVRLPVEQVIRVRRHASSSALELGRQRRHPWRLPARPDPALAAMLAGRHQRVAHDCPRMQNPSIRALQRSVLRVLSTGLTMTNLRALLHYPFGGCNGLMEKPDPCRHARNGHNWTASPPPHPPPQAPLLAGVERGAQPGGFVSGNPLGGQGIT
jgi:hypothetical protein